MGMGEVWNPHHGFCLDQQDGPTNIGLPLLVFDCHGEKGNQYWYLRRDGSITRDFLCMGRRRQGSKNDNHVELGERHSYYKTINSQPIPCSGV